MRSSSRAGSAFATVDGHSRLAYVEVKENEQRDNAVGFLLSTLRYYRGLGVRVQAVMTDNTPMFRSGKCRRLLERLGTRHQPTPPCPQGRGEQMKRWNASSVPY